MNRPAATTPAAVTSAVGDPQELTRLTSALAAREGRAVTSAHPSGFVAGPAPLTRRPNDPVETGPSGGEGPHRGAPVPTIITPAGVMPTPAARAREATVQAVAVAGCAEKLADGLPGDAVGLAATYWLDVDELALVSTTSATVRFVGRRVGADGDDPKDRFDRTEQLDGLLPGSGRVSITTKVVGVRPGQWQVTASAAVGDTARPAGVATRIRPAVARLTALTRPVALLHGPGVRPWVWPVLVLLGVLVALATQALLLQRGTGQWGSAAGFSVAAVVVGYLAAKIWYLVLHRQGLRKFVAAGTCIQGFLLGGFGTLGLGSLLVGTPVGVLLDATTPGVFLAMTMGRPGCFLGGCCAGRPTLSRWGLWSSDRRIGVRRIPVQLLEAAISLLIAVAALALVLAGRLPLPGALFVGALAIYTVARQLLFPLRGEPRRTSAGRLLTLAAAALVAVLAVLGSLLAA
ncbi:prolipoprotein diacylglyceryl transferase family protein [Pseudonocardia sp. GCM10023141]|uniref:prolipoprotein diacylglyceryl transferase family protein n=1 Tax=Pseudonocardia sp. GCM10023141 TaxID=3252653 RepID=UPI00361AEB72